MRRRSAFPALRKMPSPCSKNIGDGLMHLFGSTESKTLFFSITSVTRCNDLLRYRLVGYRYIVRNIPAEILHPTGLEPINNSFYGGKTYK